MIVYKVINKINNKIYIGYTTRTLHQRKRSHIYDTKHHRYKSVFHQAIRKYGIEMFKWTILHTVESEKIVKQLEIQEILNHKSLITENGYNMTQGGTGFASGDLNHNKIDPKFGDRNSFYGKKHSDESKQLMSQNAYTTTGEDNYFYSHKFVGEDNGFYGKEQPEEIKKLIGNTNADDWKITSPKGEIYITRNKNEFCRNHGLNIQGVKTAIHRGNKYKGGWVFEKIVV